MSASDSDVKDSTARLLIALAVAPLGYVIFLLFLKMLRAAPNISKWIKIFHAGLFGKVNKESGVHGGDLVARVLKSHGVPWVFCLSGGHISPILVACEKIGIRVVDTRHEVNAVFAADAVSRLSGRIGVAAVTAGPGVTNTVTAMKNAQMAQSPLLLIGGAAATILKGRGALQDIDQVSLFQSICKKTYSVSRMQDIVPSLVEAIQVAQSDVPGPVFVELPLDILYPYNVVADTFISKTGSRKKSKNLSARIIDFISNTYLNGIFAEPPKHQEMSSLPVARKTVTEEDIQAVARMIEQSKRPMFLVGSQCTLAPNPIGEVRSALEAMSIPTSLSGMARGLLGRSCDFQIRQARKDSIREADLIILCGTVPDFRLNYGRDFGRGKKIISVNRDKHLGALNSDLFWKSAWVGEGDPGDFVLRLQKELMNKGYSVDAAWVSTINGRNTSAEKKNKLRAEEPTDNHLNPIKVLDVLDGELDDNSILVADGGDFVATAAYVMRPRGPLMWLDPGPFGTLGVGGGFALGAKLVRPDADVWLIWGDGSAGYSLMEFDTFHRHKAPVVALVGNDACWSQIARDQKDILGSNVSCMLEYSDYEQAAAAFGARGMKIGRKDEAALRGVFREAIDTSRKGQSVLINALIGKSDFRKGSISV